MGFAARQTFGDTSPYTPSLASYGGFLFMAFRSDAFTTLFIDCLSGDGQTFLSRGELQETSSDRPSIAGFGNGLYIAWKGDGNDNLNTAQVDLTGTLAGDNLTSYNAVGVSNKVTYPDTSPFGPELFAGNGHLFMTWKGDGNDNLTVAQVL